MGKQNEGCVVSKGLLLEAEPAAFGLDWNYWIIMGQAEKTMDPSRRCQGKENLNRHSSATALDLCTLLIFFFFFYSWGKR